jgi:hypothetical protein
MLVTKRKKRPHYTPPPEVLEARRKLKNEKLAERAAERETYELAMQLPQEGDEPDKTA